MSQATVKLRADYSVPAFLIDTIELTVSLHPTETKVVSKMTVRRNPDCTDLNAELVLDGEDLTLLSVSINKQDYVDYHKTESNLTIPSKALSSEAFEVIIVNTISPSTNSSLEGLYLSAGSYCTQCEAEGFRKITYFLDRPDVLSVYTCKIITPDKSLPFLLSNGNLTADIMLESGERMVTWHDPHKKPCYLFALVAGDFDKLEQTFQTKSKRNVALELYVDKGRKLQGQHALDSLVKAMQWDESKFGLEYDLDVYMIVAVDFFNMGAMENKGLNVFNSKYVLATPDTATDQDYFNIEAIIAHEYFHNWTGNRVTCRDWFQLSLKEGLTVFRDQSFSADMFNPLSTRIDQVKVMREHQFAEDAGPMSHPIRPDMVIEMNNFYTVTVYDKGAEVIRMMHTLLGEQGFRKGMDLYFSRHDGQAVTCDDFVSAMQDANGQDLKHFSLWYSQSGTPDIYVSLNQKAQEKVLNFEQKIKQTADQKEKQALYIPIEIECLTITGESLTLPTSVLTLKTDVETLILPATQSHIIPVLLANFSAPVRVHYDYSLQELLIILQHSRSDYSKWDASQQIYTKVIAAVYDDPKVAISQDVVSAFKAIILQLSDRPAVLAEILSLPTPESLMLSIDEVNPIRLVAARQTFAGDVASVLQEALLVAYDNIKYSAYAYEKSQVNQRKLKNTVLLLLAHTHATDVGERVLQQYQKSDNMTDTLGAMKAAQVYSIDVFEELMSDFESKYRDDAVVMDKWFSLHATTQRNDALAHLDLLASHSQYSITNPNKVRSLVGSFAFYNTLGFHAQNGSGYKYVTDYLMKLDPLNPQVASRIVTSLIQFNNFAKHNQLLMKEQLSRLLNHKGLSKDLFEKVSKSLIND